MQNHYPPGWIARLCPLLGIPLNDATRAIFQAWGTAEGGTAVFNPLNTTFVLEGYVLSEYNSDGVKNYSDPVAGITATALTLIQAPYRGLLGALQGSGSSKKTAVQIVEANASAFNTWGTGTKVILELLSRV